jgi:hypothetical protein
VPLLWKKQYFIYDAVNVNINPLHNNIRVNLLKLFMLIFGQSIEPSHWLEEFENSTPAYFIIIDQSYDAL